MRRQILFLTECGSKIGFGHLTRCLSLSHAFQEAGWETGLWVATEKAAQARLPPGSRSIQWNHLLERFAVELKRADAVMIDSYTVPDQQLSRIVQSVPRIAFVDDWVRRSYHSGIVIDWTIGADEYAYPHKSPNVRYLLGSQYCAVRPEFTSAPRRNFTDQPQAVLVTFGGSDIRRLTIPVLSMLNDRFPTLHKHVIVGGGVQDRSFMDRMCNSHTTFHVSCDAAQMCAVMARSDFAICAGGQTLYELASQGLPPVVISVAENQEGDIREFEATGFSLVAGKWDMPDILGAVAENIRFIWPIAQRKYRSGIGRNCVDGHGAQRLIAACLQEWETEPVRCQAE